MRTLAIVGSGPAGFYTAEAALKTFGQDVAIDILDRLPTPYGLLRTGVAPDHQSIKAVAERYEHVALSPQVRFLGGLDIGKDIPLSELLKTYDDVILAVGAPDDRHLAIEGADLPGVLGSAAFVGWYNGHPDYAALNPPLDNPTAIIIGHGNVALDCARILAKSDAELRQSDIVEHAYGPLSRSAIRDIHLIGRRGPQHVSFSMVELNELALLERANLHIALSDMDTALGDSSADTPHKHTLELMRHFSQRPEGSQKPVTVQMDFFSRPLRILGQDRVEGVELMGTRVDQDGTIIDTGETRIIGCGLVITAIGYRSRPIMGANFDDKAGRFVNQDGQIEPGLWCVGWARRGPKGTIGTNRPDGFALIEHIAKTPTRHHKGPAAFDHYLRSLGVTASNFEDWLKIDHAEIARARPGAPREKIVSISEMKEVFQPNGC